MWMRNIKFFLMRSFTKIYGYFHKIEKSILFDSFCGTQYSDNPRAIAEKMHELYPGYELIFALKGQKNQYNIVPNYMKVIERHSIEFYKKIAICFGYVTNENIGPNIYKRKNQFFVQTWHGDRPFKKILYDVQKDGKREIPVCDNEVTNLCLAGSAFGEERYRTAFRYMGEVLNVGCPRNDCLLEQNQERVKYVKQRLHISEDMRILLYAPTFRDRKEGKQEIDFEIKDIIKHLEKKYDSKWMMLVRAHVVSKGINIIREEDKIIDVSNYPDMADLLLISDMLITDYSTSSSDFILMKRPVILFTADEEEYKKHRNLYMNIEDIGFCVAKTQEELINIIDNISEEDILKSYNSVCDFFGINETGVATEQVCKRIDDAYRKIIGGRENI